MDEEQIIVAPNWQSKPITRRLDATFDVITDDGHPYQVCPPDIDPAGAYNFDDVSAFWTSLPKKDPRKLTQAPPAPIVVTLEQAQAAKLADIIGGSNRAAAYLKSLYSEAEAESWPQQEAGARAILGKEAEVKDDTAASILKDVLRLVYAVELVQKLAAIDDVPAEDFAARIAANADAAYGAKILTLTEQRSFEKALKDAVATGDAAAVQALAVDYTLPPKDAANV